MFHQLKKSFLSPLLSLLFPPLCRYCGEKNSQEGTLFCPICQEMMELLDPTFRCLSCFQEVQKKRSICHRCVKRKSALREVASAFEYVGPTATFIKLLKYGNSPYLAKGGGAFLIAQYLNLRWPKPDVVIPVPMHWLKCWMRGYNQSSLLAQAVAKGLDTKMLDCLSRTFLSPPQAGLTMEEREKMSSEVFQLNSEPDLKDKTLLLIDDVYTTGTTLERCGEALKILRPKEIFGLTLGLSFK